MVAGGGGDLYACAAAAAVGAADSLWDVEWPRSACLCFLACLNVDTELYVGSRFDLFGFDDVWYAGRARLKVAQAPGLIEPKSRQYIGGVHLVYFFAGHKVSVFCVESVSYNGAGWIPYESAQSPLEFRQNQSRIQSTGPYSGGVEFDE